MRSRLRLRLRLANGSPAGGARRVADGRAKPVDGVEPVGSHGRRFGGGWTDADLRRIALLAETFAPGTDGPRRAALAVRALDEAVDPSQVAQLRLALRLMDSPIANLLLVRRAAPLAGLSRDRRERLLRGWATSRLALRRSGFQAWKRLLLFLAYADPGVSAGPSLERGELTMPDPGTNERWARMAYRPETPAVATVPTPVRPFELPVPGPDSGGPGRDTPGRAAPGRARAGVVEPAFGRVDLDADVVVVGSGAGGGVVAADLARAGRSVLILEAGPFVPEPEMPTDELTAFDRLYLDHGLCATADGSVAILAGATVGGGTTVNWTTSIAPPDHVRAEWARTHGIDGFDGPEMDADLVQIERELALQPPAAIPPKDAAILRGAAALGIEAAPNRRDAEGCSDCGSCGFGCRRGTKRSGLRAHLADACALGARLVPDARVVRVIVEHGRASGVEALVGEGRAGVPPRRLVVHARQVVLAAGALRTPVVLHRSGVTHPAVGAYLRLHPVAAIAARFDEPVEAWCGPLQAARSLEFLHGSDLRRSRAEGEFIVESAPAHPGLMALAFPWESAADHAAMMASARFTAPLIAICRDRGGGTVRPAPAGRARIDYRLARADIATLRRGLVEMARIARAAGSTEIVALGMPSARVTLAATHACASSGGPSAASRRGDPGASEGAWAAFLDRLTRFDFGPNRATVFSAHQMGSARMGAASADHACDPRGRVWGTDGRPIPGLYVADASLFPTALGVNPMLTVMLLARRVARTVLQEAAASSG